MERDLIFDVGVNNGDDTGYYLRRGFRVVGIEANPEMAAAVAERFSDAVRAGRLTLLNVAVADRDGVLPFYLSDGNRGVWSSFDREKATRDGTTARVVEVETRRFAGLLREYGVPYYLKVDIEGADHYCLADLDPADAPAYVSFEATPGRLADLCGLCARGYTRFKLIDQLEGFRKVVPPPLHSPALARFILAKAGKRALKRLPGVEPLANRLLSRREQGVVGGSSAAPEFPVSTTSGPMGEDTDGTWDTVDEAAYAWLWALSLQGRVNWFDLHAKRET